MLDTSGSMSGVPLAASKRFVKQALENLGPPRQFQPDRFQRGRDVVLAKSVVRRGENDRTGSAMGRRAARRRRYGDAGRIPRRLRPTAGSRPHPHRHLPDRRLHRQRGGDPLRDRRGGRRGPHLHGGDRLLCQPLPARPDGAVGPWCLHLRPRRREAARRPRALPGLGDPALPDRRRDRLGLAAGDRRSSRAPRPISSPARRSTSSDATSARGWTTWSCAAGSAAATGSSACPSSCPVTTRAMPRWPRSGRGGASRG